ncbi:MULTISPECIES: hypothetical protein [Frankia]|nr:MULTISPECIES: hypothetical protein [Frankia]
MRVRRRPLEAYHDQHHCYGTLLLISGTLLAGAVPQSRGRRHDL